MRWVEAGKLQAGDEILVDPLDERSGLVLAEVERSQWTQSTSVWMVRDDEFLSADLPNDKLVKVV